MAFALFLPASAHALPCAAELPADQVEARPGPPLRFGLLDSGYRAKPAFAAYRGLVRELGGAARVRP